MRSDQNAPPLWPEKNRYHLPRHKRNFLANTSVVFFHIMVLNDISPVKKLVFSAKPI